MIPTETLATNRARMSPLIARKAARGLSDSRRPAMSTDGRLVRRAMTREPTMVSHGPAIDQPGHDQQTSAEVRLDLAAGGLRSPDLDEVGELGDPGDERHEPVGRGGPAA